ncbi:MAG: hypothetical protein F6J98_31050 [Moorea sp. SIO4G2]|nr:hypothetical protein [Moorena sp. SIO4G2]
MGETTPVAHGGNPQDRTGSPRPRCIATYKFLKICIKIHTSFRDNSPHFPLFPIPDSRFPTPDSRLPTQM